MLCYAMPCYAASPKERRETLPPGWIVRCVMEPAILGNAMREAEDVMEVKDLTMMPYPGGWTSQ